MLPNILLDTKFGAFGNGLFLNKKRSNPDLIFSCIFAQGVTPADEISGQTMQTVKTGIHPDYDGILHGENEPVIDSKGLLTYGPYENLIDFSEDLLKSVWVTSGNRVSPTQWQATDQYNNIRQYINTIEGALYTFSFTAHVEEGAELDDYQIMHNFSASGENITFSLTETPTEYSVTVFGRIGGGNVNFGIGNRNPSNWAIITFTNMQVSETPYILPYVKTESSTVNVLQNYAAADEGNKFQIMPDEIGAFDGKVDGDERVTNGNFSAWTGDDPDGWFLIEAGDATSNISQDPVGQCRLVSDGTVVSLKQNNILVPGRRYELQFTITATSGLGIGVRNYATTDVYKTHTLPGTYTLRFTSIDAGIAFQRPVGGPSDTTLDNISIKEVSRNMGMPLVLDALDGKADGVEILQTLSVGSWDAPELDIIQEEDGTTVLEDGWMHFTGTNGDGSAPAVSNSNITETGKTYECTAEVDPIAGDIKFVSSWGMLTAKIVSKKGITTFRFKAAGTQFGIMRMTGAVLFPEFKIKSVSLKEVSPAQGEMHVGWEPMVDAEVLPDVNNVIPIISFSEGGLQGIYFRQEWATTGFYNIGFYDGTTFRHAGVGVATKRPFRITMIWGMHPTDTLSADKMAGWDFTDGWVIAGPTVIDDLNTFTTTGNGGIRLVDILEDNTEYQLVLSGDTTATDVEIRNSSGDGNTGLVGTGFGTYTFTSGLDETVNPTAIYFRNVGSGTTNITTLTVQKTNQPKKQIMVDEVDGDGHWESSLHDFDGSFDPETHINIGWNNPYPQHTKIAKIFKEPQSW